MAIVYRSKVKGDDDSGAPFEKDKGSFLSGVDDSEGKGRRNSDSTTTMMIPLRFFVLLGISLLIVLGAAALMKMRRTLIFINGHLEISLSES